ncbi:MAG: OmpA family protein [Spirochaetales bacterium]|nr:OmpA family protein [Spirochaetales bacterium]
MNLTKSTKIILAAFVLLMALVTVGKIVQPRLQEDRIIKSSAAGDVVGEIRVALDSWIGYYPLQSPLFERLMRDEGYRIIIEDDKADYAGRMERLDAGEIDFAVCTVDAYLLNGQLSLGGRSDYPGVIVTVLDESKGGDAIIARKERIDNLNALKDGSNSYEIAFTPSSPSEHLLKSVGIHFGIDRILDAQGNWRKETLGAREAYQLYQQGKVDVAVLWEPYVTMALDGEESVKLLGSEDTEKMIVDVLLVRRDFALSQPEVVQLFVDQYFQTISSYQESPDLLVSDISRNVKVDGKKTSQEQINSMLRGVKWLSLEENSRWFGISDGGASFEDEILQAINSALDTLIEYGDFPNNPLPNSGDPWSIISPDFVESAYLRNGQLTEGNYENSLEKKFSFLKESQWEKASIVGNFKILPISFMSGLGELDYNGEIQCDIIAERLSHYPNFRILIKGHTGTAGDTAANLELSQARADAVKDYFVLHYNIDSNRIRAIGMGGEEPLERKDGESSRAFSYRLKRVEVYLVAF